MSFPTQIAVLRVKVLDRKKLQQLADWLAAAVAVSLPWSTSGSGILIALWLVTVLPSLEIPAVRRELVSAAGALPVLLWALAVFGMLWADVSWNERLAGLGGFNRLLVVPLLLAQFRSSERGVLVLCGFLASACCLLVVSWAFALIPALDGYGKYHGVPVKDYILQSSIFLMCALALAGVALEYWDRREKYLAIVLIGVAALFAANIGFVITSRTTLVVAPVLIAALGWRRFGWKGVLTACFAGIVLAGALWMTSAYLRDRVLHSIADTRAYWTANNLNPAGQHLEFLRKSLLFIAAAPIIGHGTGSIPEQFRNAAAGQTGASGVASVNPHNQIFAVAIQLGLIGAGVLLAMWWAHLMLFRAGGLTGWIGMLVVLENVVSSLFNSHLFDFTQGWLYVFGVGACGGMILRQRDKHAAVRSAGNAGAAAIAPP